MSHVQSPRREVDRAALLAELRRALPADAVLDDPEDLRPYECDGLSAYRQLPLAVALPADDTEVAAVLAACRAHGKHPGIGGVYEPILLERFIEMGMRLILCGSDLSFMMAAAKERAASLRKLAPGA